jgi:hypothetical protein
VSAFETMILGFVIWSAWGIWAAVSVLKEIRALLSTTPDASKKEDGK